MSAVVRRLVGGAPVKTKGGYMGKHGNREIQERRVDEVAKYLRQHPLASRFDLHKQFCKKFNLGWSQLDLAIVPRARLQLKKEATISVEDAREMGVNVLTQLIDSESEIIRIKAEASLRAIFGYEAPTQTRIGNPDGSPLPTAVIAPTVNFVVYKKGEKE